MVLIQRHPHAQATALHQAITRIQPSRVFGLAGAITLNAAALMLLLVPVSAPVPMNKPEDPPPIYIDNTVVPPPLPIEVPIIRQQTIRDTTPVPVTPPTTQPVTDQQVIVAEGSEYVPPTSIEPVVDTGPVVPTDPGPLPSTRLEYASAPAPAYPREAILDGIEGTVLLRVLVDVDGKPLTVEIERSSGNRRLDDAARRQVLRKWMFRPAIRDGQAIQVFGMVPVSFSLSMQ
jgi:periplasmic protein TonB